jgi:hypothetical protein
MPKASNRSPQTPGVAPAMPIDDAPEAVAAAVDSQAPVEVDATKITSPVLTDAGWVVPASPAKG